MKVKLQNSELFAVIDDEDYELIKNYKWYYRQGYAVRYRSTHEPQGPFQIAMHRVILNTPKNLITDHIDGDRLNNLKSNLRICTDLQNAKNVKRHKDNKSGAKGVCKRNDGRKKCWNAMIMVNGVKIRLGDFYSLEEAVKAYDAAAIKYHGEFAKTNY